MKIDWKSRFRNGTFVAAFVTAIIALVYHVAEVFGVHISIPKNEITGTAEMIIGILTLLGIIINPTTPGLSDTTESKEVQ